ncbi:MAG: hypothetical protein CMD46_00815 [Gammaproteobacteria bacterium]|nr:hypothetical protein [Gammaproteobacteria bacterium]|tara:strand:+ start:39210 stop:39605 length:396 start_codon:yes stop_codon:yes gene_type:complete
MRDQNIKITIGSEKSFGIVFAIIFMMIALYPLFFNSSINLTFFTFSVIFIILSFIFPSIFKYPNLIWFKFGKLLGLIISPIILSIVYLSVIMPIGIIFKIIRKDPLEKLFDPNQKTYWKDKISSSSMKDQF